MSEKPAEYLKRTCLICGCHTNQTINIYEPRSGPNIVELIQAKFKFQPLNEDKYLCFSCNNWLINWHSLQALNSNDAESPSGTFRSHMNSMVQEKGAGSQHRAVCRPVAQVRPRQLVEADMPTPAQIEPSDVKETLPIAANMKPIRIIRYSKRSFRLNHRMRRCIQHRSMRTCYRCGRSIVVRLNASSNTAALKNSQTSLKCRKCRDICKWRSIYMQSLAKAERIEKEPLKMRVGIKPQNLVNSQSTKQISNQKIAFNQSQKHCLRRPLVDGKIVSMLRRLGTTLSRESNSGSNAEASSLTVEPTATRFLPTIMSPAKQKARWTRQLESDEILLDFNTAISEVLPTVAAQRMHSSSANHTRRKLTYQVSSYEANDVINISDDEDNENNVKEENIYSSMPKGLSVSLV